MKIFFITLLTIFTVFATLFSQNNKNINFMKQRKKVGTPVVEISDIKSKMPFSSVHPIFLQQESRHFPEYIFDIWGRAPSRVVQLTGEKVVQNILHVIKEDSLPAQHIATLVGEQESLEWKNCWSLKAIL
jgi:hypothetical protein